MKLLIYIILLVACILILTTTEAQQAPQFTQNMFNNMTINPGSAGLDNGICLTGIVRQQWAGFKDVDGNKVGPETFLLNVHAPVRILHGGLGGVIMQDKLGFERNINLKIGYAYHANIGFGKLGVGFNIGFHNKFIDFSKLKPAEPDPLLDQLSGEESEMLIDFSLGVFYKVANQYYIGISGNQILQSNGKELASSSDSTGSHILTMTLDRTIYFVAGYEYVFPGNPSFAIAPSVLIKTDFASTQYDICALLIYNNKFWGGVNYRVQDAVCVILGLKIKDFTIGYAYDITTSKLGLSRTGGSHEILLNYCFKIEADKGRKSYKNTRFL
ncbi:MAG: type IX secretion system membrane protein PorP/SprF [Bacteroidetes bacterium]|nr:type IX secretion system membrane protein PorP/SprF [Bacteroidota bacterium]